MAKLKVLSETSWKETKFGILPRSIEYTLKQLPAKTSDVYIADMAGLLASFQHRFVVIHLFVDYNGRMPRMFSYENHIY